MPDIRPGPYRTDESMAMVRLQPPVMHVIADDGAILFSSSMCGTREARRQIEATVDVAVAALDAASGGESAAESESADSYIKALETILSSDVTSAAKAKEIAREALG